MIKALTNIKFFIMKKQFLNLGKALNKAEQQSINGGDEAPIYCDGEVCPSGICIMFPYTYCL
jgi:hypothetical protein